VDGLLAPHLSGGADIALHPKIDLPYGVDAELHVVNQPAVAACHLVTGERVYPVGPAVVALNLAAVSLISSLLLIGLRKGQRRLQP
jgi:hypothetical protein